MLAQIQVLDELRRHARPGTTEPTLRLLAQYAEFAGWLHQDAGNTTAAMHWTNYASQWAQAIGDYQMVAYMLVRKSNIALLDGDTFDVIDLAAAARKVPGPVSPKLHALAAQQEARGWVLHRDASQFQHRLDIAASLLRDHPGDVDATAPSTCTTTTWIFCKSSRPAATGPAAKPKPRSRSWNGRSRRHLNTCTVTWGTSSPNSPTPCWQQPNLTQSAQPTSVCAAPPRPRPPARPASLGSCRRWTAP